MTTQRNLAIGRAGAVLVAVVSIAIVARDRPAAQAAGPEMLSPRLTVAPLVSGLTTPIGLAFLGRDDLFVIEKDTGRVLRVQNGAVAGTSVKDCWVEGMALVKLAALETILAVWPRVTLLFGRK